MNHPSKNTIMRFARLRTYLQAVLLICFLLASTGILAQPCLSGYNYRSAILMSNSGSGISQYQVQITLNTSSLVASGKMSNLGKDIRVLNKKGSELDYWIADGTMNTTATTLWIKVDTISGYSTDTIYLFYGNSSATAKSDASKTFYIFDDFNGTTLSSGWSTCGAGTASVSSGALNLSTNSNTIQIKRNSGITGPIIFEAYVTSQAGAKGVVGQISSTGVGYGASITSSARNVESFNPTACFTGTTLATTSTTSNTGLTAFTWISSGSQLASWTGGSQTTSSTTYTQPSTVLPFVGLSGGTGNLTIDYIRVRKYSASVPGITLGVEVSMNFTISPTYKAPLCEDGTLELTVDTIAGAKYSWTGPNSFASSLQSPKITGVASKDAGRYDLTVSIPVGCASKSSSVNVNISPKAKGGTVSGTQTVCYGSNSGVLSLSGHTGNVARWDSSQSASGPWYPITNSQLNQNYTNLIANTFYRAIVSNGNCSIDSSSYAKITITAPSAGGSLSGSTSVCYGSNSGVISLSGYTGNVVRWEYSENGNLWYSIVNKGTSNTYSNLTKTMYYRAVIQNGNCNVDYSTVALISVDQPSVGGSVSGSATVCSDINNGILILSGKVGKVVRWESQESGAWGWQSISHTSDTFNFKDLDETTSFRAVVQNGACASAESSVATVSVLKKSYAGTLSGATTVCEGSNSGTITVSGIVGSVVKWQSTLDFSTWTDISSTATSTNWYNLTDTTHYRVIVSNSGCKSDTSGIETIVVHPQSVNGYITGTEEVCVSGNIIQLNLNGHYGEIEKWEWSETGYAPWTSIANTTTSQSDTNITKSRFYRTTVKSGVCQKTITTNFEVTVDAISVAGIAGPNLTVCNGTNFGVINLTKTVGSILKWQETTDLTATWTDVGNKSSRHEFQNLNKTTYVRTIVQNGACAMDTSNQVTIEVSVKTVAGTLVGEAGFCSTTNSGQVKLTGYAGEIQHWETSVNDGDLWTTMTINQDKIVYEDLSTSTLYRTVIKSGACDQLTSNAILVEIAKPSYAGTLSAINTTLCESENFGTVNVVDAVGQIITWEYKELGGSWISIKNISTSQSFYNLSVETSYRTIAQNRFCPLDTSVELSFLISSPTVGGSIDGIDEACTGETDVKLTLSNYTGLINKWETAPSLFGPWNGVATTLNSINVLKPTQTTYFRVEVESGVCPMAMSDIFKLTVFEKSLGGSINGGKEICSTQNEGLLELTGYVGKVVAWQSKNSTGSWADINSNAPILSYAKLEESITFRSIVKNGVCATSVSNETTLLVNPNPEIAFAHDNLCDGQVIHFTQNVKISSGTVNNYEWTFSDGFGSHQDQFNKTFSLPGKYQLALKAISDKGCSAMRSDELIVGETPSVYFRLLNGLSPNTGCLNTDFTTDNSTIHADLSGLLYNWDFGNGTYSQALNPLVNYTHPGTYKIKLVATSRTGCRDSFSSEFVVLEQHKPIAGEDVQVSKGVGEQLNASGSVHYVWEPAQFLNNAKIPNPVAIITETTEFVVTGTDYFGCTSKDSITLEVIEDYKVIPNNVITPDGNGGNDVWVIKNLESYPNNQVMVFDRWGRQVFEAKSYKNDWGATDERGNILMDGTYYYVLEFPDEDKVMKGAITIIKNH